MTTDRNPTIVTDLGMEAITHEALNELTKMIDNRPLTPDEFLEKVSTLTDEIQQSLKHGKDMRIIVSIHHPEEDNRSGLWFPGVEVFYEGNRGVGVIATKLLEKN